MRCLTLVALSAPLIAATLTAPGGWRTWSPRAEIAPRTYVDKVQYRSKPGALVVTGNGIAGEYGGWERPIEKVEPGSWYRFSAYYRRTGVPHESMQILPRVDWLQPNGRRVDTPDYVYQSKRDGDWTLVTAEVQAPAAARSAMLQLFLFNAPQGTVWWDDVSFDPIPKPAARPVTITALNLRPQDTKSAAESVHQFMAAVERAIPSKTDIILLPEGITVVGTGKSYVEVAESIPGPTTETLAAVARKRSTYIAAGIYEREGSTVYNTAVLLDRKGQLVGKYRKVYLPTGEVDGGLTPGNEFPVFQTDFGKVGLMICYDVFFAHPAHALARNGAEMILLPIWGGNETLAKARAIEERIYLVTSGYDHPTYIMDPMGERLAQAERGKAAIATVDLSKRYLERYLGDMRARRVKEERVDLK